MNSFGACAGRRCVQQRQQLDAAVAAAQRRSARRPTDRPRRAGSRRRACRASRPRTCVRSNTDGPKHRLEAEPPQLGHAALELVAGTAAGRRDHGNPIAGPQRTRLQHQRTRAISSATRRCASHPSTCRSVLRRRGRPPTGCGEEPLLGPAQPLERVLDARHGDPPVLDRVHQRLERRAPARRRRRCRSAARRSRRRSPAPRRRARSRWPRSPSSRGRRSGSRPEPELLAQHALDDARATASPGAASSSDGTRTCAVMMNATPAAMAARNGTHSTRRMRSGGCSTSGSSRCESTDVSPCPGKCLPQAATPSSCSPSMMAAPSRATVGRSSDSARSPMIGFFGLVWMSSTGA